MVLVLCACVCMCVCVSVSTYSHAMRNKVAKNWYQWVHCYTGLICKQVIFVNPPCSKVMACNTSEKANRLMCAASPRPVFAVLHNVKASEVTQKSHCESKAAFKCYLQILLSGETRNNRLSAWICGLYACVYIAVACTIHRHSIIPCAK